MIARDEAGKVLNYMRETVSGYILSFCVVVL